MLIKKYKSTKLYCLRKNNLYIAWDGESLVEKPHEGIRISHTLAECKYPGYETIPFPQAYEQWYQAKIGAKA